MKYMLPSGFIGFFFFSLLFVACQGEQTDQPPAKEESTPTHQTSNGHNDKSSTPSYPGFTEDYINTDRVIWQKPNMIIEQLGDLTNKTVADIGAGTGFFALRLAPLSKKVIAIDVERRFIDYLDSIKVYELPENAQSRLETRLVTPADPKLKKGEVDAVLIVNTFMYIKDRVRYLENLRESIVEGGKLLIVDFKKKRSPIGPPANIRVPAFQVEEDLYKAGYTNIFVNDTSLDYQYIVIAYKNGPS